MERKDRLLVATPTGGNPKMGYVKSLVHNMLRIESFAGLTFEPCRGLVQQARNRIMEQAIQGNYDYVLMIDDDLYVDWNGPAGCPADHFHEILDEFEKAAAVGAVYLQESPGVIPTVRLFHPDHNQWLPATAECRYETVPRSCFVLKGFGDSPDAFAFDVVATGFMMVRVAAVRELMAKDPGPVFACTNVRDSSGRITETTDDVNFCLRLGRLGWEFLADPRIDTIHYKETGPLPWNREKWEARTDVSFPSMNPKLGRELEIDGFLCLDPYAPKENSDAPAAT